MWGNPTLFHRAKLIEKILRKEKDWQVLLNEKIKY